jgi:4a-hydroxytetrahydrobiopterin dehydratase
MIANFRNYLAIFRKNDMELPVVAGREAIAKRFRFADFSEAFAFITRVALFAEKHDHHPEWSNVYNRIDVVLATHEANGVTDLEVKLATFMDSAAAG